jgi:hypothetical protein
MSYILLFPKANNVVTQTAFPVAGANYNMVNNYPVEPERLSYIMNTVVPGSASDSYTKETLLALSYIVSSLEIVLSSAKMTAWVGGVFTVEQLFIQGGGTVYAPLNTLLSTSLAWFSYQWLINPATGKRWTISDINALTAFGLRSITSVASPVLTNNVYMKINADIAGEYVSNLSSIGADGIQKDQDFSVLVESPGAMNLLRCTSPKIYYKLPSGTEASLDAEVWDETNLLAKMPAATSNAAGKILFKMLCTLPTGQVVEGNPFFANILSRWV